MTGRWEVPESWRWAPVASIAEVVGGGTPAASDDSNFAVRGVPWITPADLSGHAEVRIDRGRRDLSEKGYRESGARLLPAGSLLFSSRAPIGYCVIAANEISTNQGFKSLKFKSPEYVPEFFRYYLLASKEYAESLSSGTTFKELSGARMAALLVPIAPVNEQRRIVAKLDALQARSRRAREALEAVPPLLEKLRQSILAAAFRGDLTKDWRAKNPNVEPASALLARIRTERRAKWEESELAKMKAKGKPPTDDKWKAKYKEPEPVDTTGLPDLPEGWCWATFEAVGEVDLGRQRAPQYQTGRFSRPYLRVANVKDDRLALDDVLEMDFEPEDFEHYQLRPGDILISEGQSPDLVGQSAIYRGGIDGLCFQKTLHRFRSVSGGPSPEFAQLVCRLYVRNGTFRAASSLTVNIAHLTLVRLKPLHFPVPPLDEQGEIVLRVGAALAALARLDSHARHSGKALTSLERAVLAKAFRGELVPQDPADEPAEAMLARTRDAASPPGAAPAPSTPRPRGRRARPAEKAP